MFQSMSRIATVAVVALTLVLASVPAAQASPFGPGPSLDTRSGWFDVALSWLSGLFGETAASPQTFGSFEAAKPITEAASVGNQVIMSGGCIDPEGRPRPTCY
ncbi:MAG: hypothetical protein QOH06_1219 [Acidobacteriota bacterium]|nr:hypothetical protein [Acidobacteriota bacterium]